MTETLLAITNDQRLADYLSLEGLPCKVGKVLCYVKQGKAVFSVNGERLHILFAATDAPRDGGWKLLSGACLFSAGELIDEVSFTPGTKFELVTEA